MQSGSDTILPSLYDAAEMPEEMDFSGMYLAVRNKEQRVYTDEQVAQLPGIDPAHPHYKEWIVRSKSAKKLLRWLQRKQTPLQILECGSGNGWLSGRLASIEGATVIGNDINFPELEQAARVFSHLSNLHFVYGDLQQDLFNPAQFDCIVFAASLQYFPSAEQVLQKTLSLLKPSGEIHILDTPFYTKDEAADAKQRTIDHYRRLGFGEMSQYYYHHTWSSLASFCPIFLYNPDSRIHFFTRHKNPFPWICIKSHR